VFLLIFTVFVGAPFVQKNEHHLNVDLVIIHLSPRTREITLIAVSICLEALLACSCPGFQSGPGWQALRLFLF
jgi:TRAP-type C4-dicarboxylate transport system permease small subunit